MEINPVPITAKFILLVCLVGILGCSITNTSISPRPTTEQLQTLESTVKFGELTTPSAPTLVMTATRQPLTASLTHTAVSKTSTAVPSPIWTPLPTLDPEQAISFTENLMVENAGCRLPCLWGIVPDKSSWIETEQFVRSFATHVGQGGGGWIKENGKNILATNYTVEYQTRENPGSILFDVQDGIITSISVSDMGTHLFYPLQTFLLEYGSPEEIFINTYSDYYGDGVLPFDIALFYPDQGISMIFWLQGKRDGNIVRGCIDPTTDPILDLWTPERNWPFEYLQPFGLDTGKEKTLEAATEMDINTFYDIATTSSGTICIETPADLWP